MFIQQLYYLCVLCTLYSCKYSFVYIRYQANLPLRLIPTNQGLYGLETAIFKLRRGRTYVQK